MVWFLFDWHEHGTQKVYMFLRLKIVTKKCFIKSLVRFCFGADSVKVCG